MVKPGPWGTTLGLIIATVTAAIVGVRLVTRSRWLPTTIGTLVAFEALLIEFGRNEEGGRQFIPTPAAFNALKAAFSEGIDYTTTTVAPAPVTPALLCVIATVLCALFIVAEHLAVSWRFAATSGVLLILPWLPAIMLQLRVSAVALAFSLGLWLLTLALTRRPTVVGRGPAVYSGTAAALATLGLVAVVAPTALGGPGWGMIPRFTTPEELDTTTRLNLALDLRDSLTTNSDSAVIVYVTSGAKPDALRLFGFVDFDGERWARPEEIPADRTVNSGVLWPVDVEGFATSEHTQLTLQVVGLAEVSLPVPPVPRTVSVGDEWSYSPEFDEVITSGQGTQGMTYTVVADFDYLNAATLRGLLYPGAEDELLDPGYLELNPAIDVEGLTAVAKDITAGANTRYDQALALQEFFRSTKNFTYDTTVTPSKGDSVSHFLEERRGFCLQFASSMVVLARTLGIPARLAEGFLPGTAQSDGTYIIKGSDAHTWPELYFAGVGWVRFEPTPAAQSGSRPSHATPATANVPVSPDDLSGQGANPLPDGAQGEQEDPAKPVAPEAQQNWWPAVIGAAAVLAVIVLGAFLLWRRRSLRGNRLMRDPEEVWAFVRRGLPEDARWPLSSTPGEAREHIRLAALGWGWELPEAVLAKLTTIADAVSDHRYSPSGSQTQLDELVGAADELVAAAQAGGTTTRPARDDGRSVRQPSR